MQMEGQASSSDKSDTSNFYPELDKKKHGIDQSILDIENFNTPAKAPSSRPGGMYTFKREVAWLSALRESRLIEFDNLSTMWLSCLFIPETLYKRKSDGLVMLCLGNEPGMVPGIILDEHICPGSVGEHASTFYTMPSVKKAEEIQTKLVKMFLTDVMVTCQFNAVPAEVVAPVCTPQTVRTQGIAWLQTSDEEDLLRVGVLNGHPVESQHLKDLCTLLGCSENAKVEPGRDSFTKWSWAECLVSHVLADEPYEVQDAALLNFVNAKKNLNSNPVDAVLLKAALNSMDPAERSSNWDDLEEEVEDIIVHEAFPVKKPRMSRKTAESKDEKRAVTSKLLREVVPSYGERWKTYLVHQRSRSSWNAWYAGGIPHHSKSKRFTRYTKLNEFEAFRFVVNWMWDTSEKRKDVHPNKRPDDDTLKRVYVSVLQDYYNTPGNANAKTQDIAIIPEWAPTAASSTGSASSVGGASASSGAAVAADPSAPDPAVMKAMLKLAKAEAKKTKPTGKKKG